MALISRTDTLGGTATDNTLPLDRLDRFLEADGATALAPTAGGVLAAYDLSSSVSWPNPVAPTNGAALKDLTERANDAVFTLAGTGSTAYAGGGWDVSNVANVGSRIEAPASVAASIWGGGTLDQYFLKVMYVKLPTQANWPTAAAGFTRPLPLSTFTTISGGLIDEDDFVTIAMVATGSQLRSYRATAGKASGDSLTITPAAADYGSVVQLAVWRNAAGQGFRLKSANSNILATAVVGVNNTVDFSAKKAQIGVGGSVWKPASTSSLGRVGLRYYRWALENLRISGRDPVSVLDADWARVTGLRGNPFS